MTFEDRLNIAFNNASMAEIARRLDISHPTVQNYFKGRLPAPEVLIKIATETNVSLNWLLTGQGRKETELPNLNFDQLFENKIREIVCEELDKRDQKNKKPMFTIDVGNKTDIQEKKAG